MASHSPNTDERAQALAAQLTLDEKLTLVRSFFLMNPTGRPSDADEQSFPAAALGTAGFVPGIARLGIPAQQQSDASLGIAPGPTPLPERAQATALPASIVLAATWNLELARAGGEIVGAEARALGINVMLAGGANLARDPRCGRNFEYLGEDPLLTGIMAGEAIAGIQSAGIVSTIKHFALNAQETGRNLVDEIIDEAALRESDLLAFQIAIERGQPGSVMTAYNKVNGKYCSQNSRLINDILKGDWGFAGWVMSDWGSVHSTREAALAGLDQQSGFLIDPEPYFGDLLKAEAQSDPVIAARLNDMVTRILRSMIAVGAMESESQPNDLIDFAPHRAIAQRQAEEGIVLLKNENDILPLTPSVGSIAIIGANADTGVLAGGGSSCVQPEGSVRIFDSDSPIPGMPRVYHPSSPLRAIQAAAPDAQVTFHDGINHDAAVALARNADIAIVFAERWDCEAGDAPDLSLPHDQDALIAAVATANPRTIVVLQTGGPVLTPWLDSVGVLLQAWYPGHRGGEAIANILFGAVNPSGRLPISFPPGVDQLPRPRFAGYDDPNSRQGLFRFGPAFSSTHVEGADVGYRWHEVRGNELLFPFGFGLSYTSFGFSGLTVRGGNTLSIQCNVTNTGAHAGKQVVQVYARPPHAGAAKRLVGFVKLDLAPSETKAVQIEAEPRLLARFDVAENKWRIDEGAYQVFVGASSADTPLTGSARLNARFMRA